MVHRGAEAIPVLGIVNRLRNVTTRPVEMVHDAAKAYGNVPTVGFWFPRRHNDHDSLQELALAGKRIMASMLLPQRVAELPRLTASVMADHCAGWGPVVDLSESFPPAIYEISVRFFAGDEFWGRYGTEITPLLRAIADGIEVPRATLAITPWRWAMREYHATRRLSRVLREAARELPASPLFRSIRDAGTAEGDVAWMAMYILWNAVTYPGSYGLWTLMDVVSRPDVHRSAAETDDPVTMIGA